MRRAGEVCYVDAHNRMGRGRGEVCFGSREVMHKAKEELNGYDINGKRIDIVIKVCKYSSLLIMALRGLITFVNTILGPQKTSSSKITLSYIDTLF